MYVHVHVCLKINDSEHYNVFFRKCDINWFFSQITMPTKLSDNSNTLIDNIFTNNICKPHESGILVTPISDHLMQFCIFKGNYEASNDLPKYIEVETINSKSINNFKCALSKSNVFACWINLQMQTLIAITISEQQLWLMLKKNTYPRKLKSLTKKKTFLSEMDDRRAFTISDTQKHIIQ